MDEIIKDFEAFKMADQVTRDYFVYSKLIKLDHIDNRYARKWVERAAMIIGGTIGMSFLYAIISLVINK